MWISCMCIESILDIQSIFVVLRPYHGFVKNTLVLKSLGCLGVKITAVLETNVWPIPWYFWSFKKSTLYLFFLKLRNVSACYSSHDCSGGSSHVCSRASNEFNSNTTADICRLLLINNGLVLWDFPSCYLKGHFTQY
jgi:hypothetical protein